MSYVRVPGVGSVSSIAIAVPNTLLSVAGSPITTSGTITLSLQVQDANKVFAGPTTGADAAPTFRSLVADDIPALPYATAPVPNSDLADMATQTIKGRTTAGTGSPEDLSATQATAILDVVVGDSGSGGTKGLVPAPASGDAAAGKFLKADGTFQVPAGGGGSITTLYKNSDIRVNVTQALGWKAMTGNSQVIPAGTWYIDTHFTFSSNTAPALTSWSTIGGGLYFANGTDAFAEPLETDANATLVAGGGLQISTGAPVAGQGGVNQASPATAATVTIRGPFYVYVITAPVTVYVVPYGDNSNAANASVFGSLFAFKIA